MPTGEDLLELAATRIGASYVYGADVDLNDPNWGLPGNDEQSWDCAEFCSWVVRQVVGKLYGCLDSDSDNPDPWTGAWARDARKGTVISIPVKQAANTPGAILLRYRQGGHHIVFVAEDHGTIEAKSASWGVCRGRVGSLDNWDWGITIPGVTYAPA
jgi:N-acetylmuramoyl-L-alanine amidase